MVGDLSREKRRKKGSLLGSACAHHILCVFYHVLHKWWYLKIILKTMRKFLHDPFFYRTNFTQGGINHFVKEDDDWQAEKWFKYSHLGYYGWKGLGMVFYI